MVLSRLSPFTALSIWPGLVNGWNSPDRVWAPMDVRRTDDGYRIETALPGFKPEDIEVTLDQGTLTISAKRSEEKKAEQGRYLHREVYSGSYMRRLTLPRDVKAEDISTVFENGMLTVEVKYDVARNAVKIPVTAANTPELASSNE